MNIEPSPGASDLLSAMRQRLRTQSLALEHELAAHQHSLSLLRLTENAFGRFVPRELLALLNAGSVLDLVPGQNVETTMTILFSDIRGFTKLSESMTPGEIYAFVNSYLSEIEPAIAAEGGVIDKFIGDAVMALFPGGADAGLRGAIGMLRQLDHYNAGRARAGYAPVHIGVGLNTGIVMLGLVGGVQHTEVTVLSDAVNVTSRLESMTKLYGVPLLISEDTLYNLREPALYHIRFVDRVRAKGRQQPLSVYEVYDADPVARCEGKDRTRPWFEEALAYYHRRAVDRAVPLLEQCLQQVPDDEPARIYLARCHRFLQTGEHEGTGELGSELPWDARYSVGEATIDSQHRELLDHMNTLGRKIAQGDRGGLQEVMDFLGRYAHFHFDTEEAMMRKVEYPLLASHLQEHHSFVQRYERLAADIAAQRSDPLYLGFQIQLFLFDWFVNHTTKTDRHLGRFIASRSRSTSVAG